jgi:glycosyltransferase involved in cell wall biosynthesis
MNLLAICHDIEPLQSPQAIQIGRHLAHLKECGIALVSGGRSGEEAPAAAIPGLTDHLRVADPDTTSPSLQRIGRLALPVYGKAPDGLGRWRMAVLDRLEPWLAGLGRKPDVIASFGEPMSDHLIGLALKQRLGLPWLAHFSDPWVDNPFRRGGPLTRGLNEKLERDVIEAADIVVFTSPETAALVRRRYGDRERAKFRVLEHGFDSRLFPRREALSGPVVIRHIGSFYGDRTPFPLLEGLRKLVSASPGLAGSLTAELVGSMPERMARKVRAFGLPEGTLRLAGSVGYRESLALMTRSDLLLLVDAPAQESVFLASKLVDYIGAGRPILAITPPGAAKRVVTALGGASVPPQDPDAIAAALRRAIEEAVRLRQRDPATPWGNPDARQGFEAATVAARLRSCLEQARSSA